LWLFALGAFVPDRTYESGARLRVSMRDVYSGKWVGQPILVEPGPVDLNMFERCGFMGFVQSVLVPPFWTSIDDPTVVATVRYQSTARLLISLVRRLKSVEVAEQLRTSGPAMIDAQRVGAGWRLSIASTEPLSAVALRLDGQRLPFAQVSDFERRLLESGVRDGAQFKYTSTYVLPIPGRRLQISVQTEGARIRSSTISLEDGR
jgi:hypothetical protein